MGGERLMLIGESAMAAAAARALSAHGFAPARDSGAAIVAIEPLGVALPLPDLRERHGAAPLLVLSANLTVSDRVRALDAGADDWIGAPFAPDELAARLRALLRRTARLRCGDLVLDLATRSAARDGIALELRSREFELLAFLARRLDEVVPRAELLAAVWGRRFDPGTNTVAVHVSRLRARLDRGFAVPMLHTDTRGYMLSATRGIGLPPRPTDLRRRVQAAQDRTSIL